MKKQVTKAIIPVAGWGTRRLPITKTIEKCMLPIGNRPIIDYVVQDCIKAGITEIVIIVSPGSSQVRDYYSPNKQLEDNLIAKGKSDRVKLITPPEGIKFTFIDQPDYSKYGTAIPVALAMSEIGPDESVVVLMGDDFTYNYDKKSDIAKMLSELDGAESAILGAKIDPKKVERYGVIEFDDSHNFVQIIEKPTVGEAPSNIINISKYVLNSQALKLIADYAKQDDVIGEYFITIPLNKYVEDGGKMKVISADGEYLDGGSVEGWHHANQVVIKNEY